MSIKSRLRVYVIDDDASVREALKMLLFSAGMEAFTYESAEAFIQSDFIEENACLITDIKMIGLSGLELQQKLVEQGVRIPIVFLTAFDSKADRDQAYRMGAAGFFRKPVDDQAMLDAIFWAISGHKAMME